MATEIGRSFDEITRKIKELNSEIRDAKSETRQLDSVLKLDPTNIDTATKRFESLQKTVVETSKKLVLLRQQQKQAEADFAEGKISAKDFEKLGNQVKRTENELQLLELRADSVAKSTAKMGIESLNAKLEKTQKISSTLSKTLLGIVGVLGAITVSAIKTADELGDVATKYQITVEELQLQRNLYNIIATDSAGYENILGRLSAIMKRVEAGAGSNYIRMLERLGVETQTAEGKTKALGVLYTEIYNALRNVADATERAAIANALFGEEGYELANVAGTSAEEIEKLNKQMLENGLISTEAANQAGAIDDKYNSLKLQYMSVAVTLMQSLIPSLEILMNFAKETIIPIIERVTSVFADLDEGQQKTILTIGVFLIILPKIIGLFKLLLPLFGLFKTATLGQAAATTTLSVASAPLIPIFLAIAAALVLIISLISLFSKNVKNTVKELTDLTNGVSELENKYASVGTGITVANETITQTNQTKDININVDLEATGDTPISQQNAEMVGLTLAEQIDLLLGGKI